MMPDTGAPPCAAAMKHYKATRAMAPKAWQTTLLIGLFDDVFAVTKRCDEFFYFFFFSLIFDEYRNINEQEYR